jgi:hypothetical protein
MIMWVIYFQIAVTRLLQAIGSIDNSNQSFDSASSNGHESHTCIFGITFSFLLNKKQ